MKKVTFFLCIILYISLLGKTFAVDNSEIMESQKDTLNIRNFVKEANTYTSSVFNDIEADELLNSALTGQIDNSKIVRNIWKIFGKEITNSVASIGSIIVIIIIHSIIKSVSDGFENKSVSQITYYVQYILIVTIVMTSFAEVVTMCKDAIDDLVTFINLLIPILITLMIATRKYSICKYG